ncbi:MAG: TonB-dependent receptor plug domain-containing protein, partial [Pseudomonadota bacterium]
MTSHRRPAIAAAIITLAIGGPAFAQAAPQGAPAADQPDADDGEILVTARRREETLVSVPVVVTALGAADLLRNKADDLSRIGELTPTVIVGAFKSNGGGTIAIRGISSPANQTGFEQSVSVAIDGVQTSDGRVATLGFFDLAQVEVLKGPQALFFGKNSPAGVISIKTADPTSDPEFTMRGSYEFVGDEYQIEGAASTPLGENAGVRLAVKYRYLDGWLRNTAQPIANPFYRAATGAPIGASMLPGTSDPRPG